MIKAARLAVVLLLFSAVALCAAGAPGDNPGRGNPGDNPGRGSPGGGNPGRGGRVKARQTRSQNGLYRAIIMGSVRGTGTATAGNDSISIVADVVGSNKTAGRLVVPALSLDGPYFSGPGTAMGLPIRIQGRLDAAKASRLVAVFEGSGFYGRIIGILSADPGDETWDDRQ